MTIREYLDQLADWGSDDREKYLRPLMGVLSPVSLRSLQEHQRRYFEREEADYEAFKDSQNEEIVKYLQLETANVGAIVREELGLPPLTLETEVEIPD